MGRLLKILLIVAGIFAGLLVVLVLAVERFGATLRQRILAN